MIVRRLMVIVAGLGLGCGEAKPVEVAVESEPRTTCDAGDALETLGERVVEHAKQGRFDEAERCLRLAVEQRGGVEQYFALGSAHLDRANALFAAGEADGAIRQLERSAEAFESALLAGTTEPAPAQLHQLLAGNYYHQGKPARAIAHLERLLLRPDSLAEERALAHQMLDMLVREPRPQLGAEQTAALDDALGRASEIVSPGMLLAGRAPQPADRASFSEALALLERVVAAEPRNWPAHWTAGKAHEALGDRAAALTAFRRAGQIHPYHPDVAREELLALLALERTAEAIAVAERAVKYNVDDPGLLANLALVQLLNGDVAAAESNAARALAAAPGDPINNNLVRMIADVKAGTRARPTSLAQIGAPG